LPPQTASYYTAIDENRESRLAAWYNAQPTEVKNVFNEYANAVVSAQGAAVNDHAKDGGASAVTRSWRVAELGVLVGVCIAGLAVL
jgi:hypothetical protein